MAQRQAMEPAGFMSDPLGEMLKLYQWLGWEMNDDIGRRMSVWQEQNFRGERRLHPEDFALDEASLRERFQFYIDRFSAFM
jgi:hypothetical protein